MKMNKMPVQMIRFLQNELGLCFKDLKGYQMQYCIRR